MQEQDAVILLGYGKGFLVFPGDDGYLIEWSPGTKMIPLTKSVSGHLVIQCDHWKQLAEEYAENSDDADEDSDNNKEYDVIKDEDGSGH